MGHRITEPQILEALSRVKDPDLGQDVVRLGFIKDLAIEGDQVSFTLQLTTPACPMRDLMTAQIREAALSVPGVKKVQVRTTARVPSCSHTQTHNPMPGVRNIVAITSGKGGVGKSTVAANLAVSLALCGARVGLMDTDFYGPSIPILLGSDTPPESVSETRIAPAEKYGIKVVSMAYFLPRDKAVIWRGPMLHRMIRQFSENVDWGELDYLIVDLPPGTGDVQLSLCQTIPVTGAVVVTTPQDLALTVAAKAISLFTELKIPILGIVENMSFYTCPHCGQRDDIFGHGGAERLCGEMSYPFLGAIPLSAEVREQSDRGQPAALRDETSSLAENYRRVARELAARISVVRIQGGTSSGPSTGTTS